MTNAQAEELASLRNQSTEEISVATQKLAYAEQHTIHSEQQIHLMQHEVIADNNQRARIAEQSRQAEAANDIKEDKIKILSNQMQELIARLDEESRHRARLEAENADLRARSELPVRPMHMGTPPPGLPDTNRESTGGDRPFMPPLPPEGVVSLASSHVDPNQDGGLPGGEPPKGPDDDDDDGDDDDDSDDDHRRRKDDRKKKKKKDKRRKKSRGRRRRRSPSSSPSSSSSSSRRSSSQEASLIRRQSRS